MNISDIEALLPWGLHDAHFEAIEIDWPNARLTLRARVMMSEKQDMEQRAKLVLSGLVFCTIDPPQIDPTRGYEPAPASGLSPPASESPTISGITGTQGPTRWPWRRGSALPPAYGRSARQRRQLQDKAAPPR